MSHQDQPTFVKVPTFVHESMAQGQLSPTALALYVVLRSFRNHQKQVAWPSHSTLAKAMGMKQRHNVVKYVKELETAGALTIEREPGGSNTYSFPEEKGGVPQQVHPADSVQEGCTPGGTGGVPQQVHPGTSRGTGGSTSGGTQTRLSEPDREKRLIEHGVDTRAAAPRRAQAPVDNSPSMDRPLMAVIQGEKTQRWIPDTQQPRLGIERRLQRPLTPAEENLAAHMDAEGKAGQIEAAIQALQAQAVFELHQIEA